MVACLTADPGGNRSDPVRGARADDREKGALLKGKKPAAEHAERSPGPGVLLVRHPGGAHRRPARHGGWLHHGATLPGARHSSTGTRTQTLPLLYQSVYVWTSI